MTVDANTNLYLRDLAFLLKEELRKIRHERDGATSHEDKLFLEGRELAYVDVLSLMQQQTIGFGLSLASIGLDEYDPYNDR